MKSTILLGTILFITSSANASCLETIKSIQDALGTSAGSYKPGAVDLLKSENDLFRRALNISKE